MITPFNIEFKQRFENAHIAFIEPVLKVAYQDEFDFRSALANILSPFSFLLGSELKKIKPNNDTIVNSLKALKITKNRFEIVDSDLLITPIETRGQQMKLIESTDKERILFNESFFELKQILPPYWVELVSILKTVTLVTIPGKESLLTHFSGSDTDRWGAIHMSTNLELLNIAECLTHEASHHWMNLYEFYNENEFIQNGWIDHSYVSPWRRDKRPLMGIFHGIYVWTNVFVILQYLGSQQKEINNERTYYIAAQVQRGIELLKLNLDKMNFGAKDLFFQIKSTFENAYENVPLAARIKYTSQILFEEKLKHHD